MLHRKSTEAAIQSIVVVCIFNDFKILRPHRHTFASAAIRFFACQQIVALCSTVSCLIDKKSDNKQNDKNSNIYLAIL